MKTLSEKEIKERLQEFRNIKVLYEKAKERIEIQKEEIKNLKKENVLLKKENKEQKEEITNIKLQVEELRTMIFGKSKNNDKANGNSFSGKLNRSQRRKLKKIQRKNSSYQRTIPKEEEVTETKNYQICNCVHCKGKLTKKVIKTFFEIDIPLEKKKVIKHNVEKGYCNKCKRYSSSIKIPTTKVVIGENIKKLIVYDITVLRLSHKQVKDNLMNRYNIKISSGEIVKILDTYAYRHRKDYERLKDVIRKENVIHFDETGDRVRDNDGSSQYTWIMQGKEKPELVLDMGRVRGKGIAEKLYGNSNSIIVSDNYGAYNNLSEEHQLCWAHLHRKLRDLAESNSLDKEYLSNCILTFKKESNIYKKVRKLSNRDDLSERQRKIYYTKLKKELYSLSIVNKYDPKKLRTYKKTLSKNIDKYLTCIKFPNVPCDNNQAERSLRHIVLKRKTSFGHITMKGAETMSILMSIFLTVRNMMKEGQSFFEAYDAFEV